MLNYKLTIAYDGTLYAGWQRQTRYSSSTTPPELQTVQGILEKALHKILREKIRLQGSGRTDSGVHAVAQVATFKARHEIDLRRLKHSLNGVLPRDIVVLAAEEAPVSFHARFSVASKVYRYVIYNEETRSPFLRSLALWIRHPLDAALMRKEVLYLVGRHDFRSFQASDRRYRPSTMTVKRLKVAQSRGWQGLPFLEDKRFIFIDIEAEGFLRNMVRNIVGTLIEIGRGRMAPGALAEILNAKDRRRAGPCAPAQGLYLTEVVYPDKSCRRRTGAATRA